MDRTPLRLLRALLGRPARSFRILAAVGALCVATPIGAQEPPAAARPDSVVARPRGISPGGAFLRAALVPGWGHAAIGAYHRSAFYFLSESASVFMLLKTRRRYAQAEDRVLFTERLLRSDLEARGVTDAAEIRKALNADATLKDLQSLQDARRQQTEDWTAVTIFLMLLSGVDAYVSAHLRDFPVPLDVGAAPVGDGRVEVSFALSLPR